MEWNDSAITINSFNYGETSQIITLFTENHGLYKGMVKGARSKTKRGIYQIGNKVNATWKARLADQLGNYNCELEESFASYFMQDSVKLSAFNSICSLINNCILERDPNREIYVKLLDFLQTLKAREQNWFSEYMSFEIDLLTNIGFGLDLSCCAATGEVEDLIYVSPKTGRAVSKGAGHAYKHLLLSLPSFLLEENWQKNAISLQDLNNGLALVGYFFNKYVFASNGKDIPEARKRFVQQIYKLTEKEIIAL